MLISLRSASHVSLIFSVFGDLGCHQTANATCATELAVLSLPGLWNPAKECCAPLATC